MHKVNYFLALIFVPFCMHAQEHSDHLSPLHTNPVLVQIAKQNVINRITPPPPNPIKVLKLPFLDDFSKPSSFPDTSIWINGGVFTNYTYPICPHTLGVATFDGVNSYGLPYNPDASPNGSYPADTLTSMYIGLGSYAPADSIYFSFYWEAGGLGSYPKTNDSLVLEFSNGKTWIKVWYQLGYQPIAPDTGFHYVLIPIANEQYFLNSFQFRFRNYACTAGNLDHWHIDEVYLNQFRSYADTSQQDVAFVYQSPSMLTNYQYEPWEQFQSGDLKSSVFIYERNNNTIAINTLYKDTIIGPAPNLNSGYSGGVNNFQPFFSNGYNSYSPQCQPPLNFIYSAPTGPATWTITYNMTASPDFDHWNDTLRFAQAFSNFYAYDDGTAEANYSVIPFNSTPTQLAEQLTLNKTDTLLGIQMFFNYVLANTRGYIFRLAVWADAGGQPADDPIFEDPTLYSPDYTSIDQFTYYKFTIPQTVSGIIYVGIVTTSGDSINIGYDMNNNHQNQVFYNVGYGWSYSSFTGSIMMRPVFGNTLFNSINEIDNSKSDLTIYPNPAKDEVGLSESMLSNTIVRIYASDGRLCYENLNFSGNCISTAQLPEDIYIVQLVPKESKAEFKKLLISR